MILNIIKKIISFIVILLIVSCSNDKKKSQTTVIKRFTSPVNIDSFLTSNQKIDTFKLQTDIINKKFNFDYKSYNHYEALNTNLNNKGMFRYNDYLIVGKDEKGEETVLCFFTQNLKKGNAIWGQTVINQPKKDILELFKNQIIDDSYPLKYYYGAYKDGYNVILYSDNDSIIDGALIVKSKKSELIRHSITRVNQFNYFDGKAPY